MPSVIRYRSVEKWYKIKIYSYISWNKFSMSRVIHIYICIVKALSAIMVFCMVCYKRGALPDFACTAKSPLRKQPIGWWIYMLAHDIMMTSSKWKHFPRCQPFVRGIHRSSVNSRHRGQWRGVLMFSSICAWINGWVNNHEAGDLRCHCVHYDIIVITITDTVLKTIYQRFYVVLSSR